MYVFTDKSEKTEIIHFGTIPIRRLINSGFLCATDFYNYANPVMMRWQRKPTPYWYSKLKNLDRGMMSKLMENVLIEKYFLNTKWSVRNYSKLKSPNAYIKTFGLRKKLYKRTYYFHPVIFFSYYDLFFSGKDNRIINYLYNEYFQKNIVQGNFAQEWLQYIYDRYNKPGYREKYNQITYFHDQIRILLGPLGEYLIDRGTVKKSALPCYHPHLSDLIGALQLLDISIGTNRRISDKLRKKIIDSFIERYNYKSHILARTSLGKDETYKVIKTLSVFSNRNVYRADLMNSQRFFHPGEEIA